MCIRHLKALKDAVKDSIAARRDSIRTSLVTKPSPEEDKNASLRVIETLIPLLLAHAGPYVADTSPGAIHGSAWREYEKFRVSVDPLDLSRDPGTSKFFFQMSRQEIEKLPEGPISDRVQNNMETMRDVIDHGTSFFRQQGSPMRGHVQILECYFRYTIILPRISPKKQRAKLAFFTGWRLLRGYSPRCSRPPPTRPDWACTNGWICNDSRFPHFKATMWTDANAVEQEPLCAEVVTILGIMAERHRAEELRAHTIIPVLLVSFVGPRHARILLAHFDGERLKIEMSKLLPITTDDNTNMDTLIRWWAAKVNRTATTTEPLKHGVENLPPSTSNKCPD